MSPDVGQNPYRSNSWPVVSSCAPSGRFRFSCLESGLTFYFFDSHQACIITNDPQSLLRFEQRQVSPQATAQQCLVRANRCVLQWAGIRSEAAIEKVEQDDLGRWEREGPPQERMIKMGFPSYSAIVDRG